MNPQHLACPSTNTQLEPIRRAIESTVPSCNAIFPTNPEAFEKPETLYYTGGLETRYSNPILSSTSIENPLYGLTDREYRTLRRYQAERNLPERFQNATSSQANSLLNPSRPPPANPTFQTSYQEYGKYQPNVHTLPYSYHGLKTQFTAEKTSQGMYRNHSLNI